MQGPYSKLWTEFFAFLLWLKREAHGPWKQGQKKWGCINCRTDRANEANKMFIIWLCWIFRKKNEVIWRFDRWSKARGPYGYLWTWNWPITAREVGQPYNKSYYYLLVASVSKVLFLYYLKSLHPVCYPSCFVWWTREVARTVPILADVVKSYIFCCRQIWVCLCFPWLQPEPNARSRGKTSL